MFFQDTSVLVAPNEAGLLEMSPMWRPSRVLVMRPGLRALTVIREGVPVARPGVDARDVLMALGGISLMAANEEQRELAGRLIDLLLYGVVGDVGG